MAGYLIYILSEKPTTGQVFEDAFVFGQAYSMEGAAIYDKPNAYSEAQGWCRAHDLNYIDCDGPFRQLDFLSRFFKRKPRWAKTVPPGISYEQWVKRRPYDSRIDDEC